MLLFGLVAPIVLAVTLTSRPHRLGLGLGWLRRGAVATTAGIPLSVLAVAILAQSDSVRDYYRIQPSSSFDLAVSYLPRIARVELCFRGALLFGLLGWLGRRAAIAMSVAPYALVHLDKPPLEALGSIPVGIALCAVALWTRSVWYGVLLHLAGAVALTLLARAN